MSGITTHVLDTSRGRPAGGVAVALERRSPDGDWVSVGTGVTDSDGRCKALLGAGAPLLPGTYRLTFDTAAYHRTNGVDGFFPEVMVTFVVSDPSQHYHVPLLLSNFGYSTYRGS